PAEVAQALAPFDPKASITARGRRPLLALAALSIFLAGCLFLWLALRQPSQQATQPKGAFAGPANSKNPRILFVLPKDFMYSSYEQVRHTLVTGGAEVRVACNHTLCKPIRDSAPPGASDVEPAVLLDKEVNASEYDAVVFGDGYIWEYKDQSPAR